MPAWSNSSPTGVPIRDALVRLPEPVNKFPDFIGYVVRRLKILCPTLGKVKSAQILARAGLHLGPTTVRRMQRDTRWPGPRSSRQARPRSVTARTSNHLWHVDLTTVPTALGFWVSWLPFALPQVWPFCWWLAVAIDHFSRCIIGFAVYPREPSSAAVRRFLKGVFRGIGEIPKQPRLRPRNTLHREAIQAVVSASRDRSPLRRGWKVRQPGGH
jgi:transposase InsO family protein